MSYNSGIFGVPEGVIAWIDIFDGDVRETLFQPVADEVYVMCNKYGVDYEEFNDVLGKARKTGSHGVVLNVPVYKESKREEKVEVFPPGTRVRLKPNQGYIKRDNKPGYVFMVVVGGYVVEGDWVFHSCKPDYFNSEDFEKVE